MKRFTASIIAILFVAFLFSSVNPIEAQTQKYEVFAHRRAKLMEKMEGGIAVFNNSSFKKDFYYLTGFDESGSSFLLIPDADKKFIMFVRSQHPAQITWTGRRFGVEEVTKIFGADEAYPVSKFDKILREHLKGKEKIYCILRDKELTSKLTHMVGRPWNNQPKHIIDILEPIHEMRLIKDPGEIALMRKAVDVTCDALIEAMKAAEPGMYEYEMKGLLNSFIEKTVYPQAFHQLLAQVRIPQYSIMRKTTARLRMEI